MSDPGVGRRRAGAWVLLLSMGAACEDVETSPAEGNAMLAVPAPQHPSSAPEAPNTVAPLPPPVFSPDPDPIENAPEPPGSPDGSFGLEIDSRDLGDLGCRRWLDFPESELRVTDIEVTFTPDDGGDATSSMVAETPEERCSAIVLPPFTEAQDAATPASFDDGGDPDDAGGSQPDAASLRDAGASTASGGDAGTSTTSGRAAATSTTSEGDAATSLDGGPAAVGSELGFRAVDLTVEGWYLDLAGDGLWLEFCPNACYTLTAVQSGRLAVTVWYDVVGGMAAR